MSDQGFERHERQRSILKTLKREDEGFNEIKD
jgi:hypothetical protein